MERDYRDNDDFRAVREEARRGLEEALYEIKRVIVGQDAMLERMIVALLAGGHVLLEGVPGLAKTLTIKTTSAVLGGSFSRIQFTPDLVPSDLIGTRIYRAKEGTFDTELGPVFCNFLLADEINRAPARCSRRCWRSWPSTRCPWAASAMPCRRRSSSWPRRTRSSRRASTRCPRPSVTAS